MGGSVDKNAELKVSLLYFVDEAIGYRHSLHFFRRWLETGEQSELEGLILEVGRENFVDLAPIIETVKNPYNMSGTLALNDFIKRFGIFSPKEEGLNIVKIAPLPDLDNTILENLEGNNWVMHNWVESNTHNGRSPFYSIANAFKLLNKSNGDFLAIFKLFEQMFGLDTIFSCVIDDDIKRTGKAISYYYPKQANHINKLASTISNNLELNWKDALSRNQIKSKFWLIEKLIELKALPKNRSITEPETTTLVVGGWVGMIPFLASMLNKNLDSVINVDIDKSVHSAAHELNAGTHNNFKNSGTDVREVNLAKYKKLLIIDTIVEHFEDHGEWVKTLPAGATVVLQGNDMFDVPDHVNCHLTLEDFIESCGLNSIIWSGELNLHNCTRYMAIGTT
jgi:hypothetical protein